MEGEEEMKFPKAPGIGWSEDALRGWIIKTLLAESELRKLCQEAIEQVDMNGDDFAEAILSGQERFARRVLEMLEE